MQKLHLVGFTPELDGLILSTRKGAKTGSFVVSVDASVLEQLVDVGPAPAPRTVRANGVRAAGPRASRPESTLTPREMQELLRGGWTLEEVAVEANVDVDWVSRFAAPVMAEMRLILEQARDVVFEKPRVGPSALPLAPSVRRNVAERGVRFTDEDFDEGWRAYQRDDVTWIVAFEYTSRGKPQVAEWAFDLELGDLLSPNRLGAQLGYVQSTRRKVSTAPPPKPKPKAAAVRAAARQPAPPPAPPRRAPARASKTPAPTAAVSARARSRQPASRQRTTAATRSRTSKPATPAPVAARTASRPPTEDRDPWREALRLREAELAVGRPQPVAAPVQVPAPAPAPAPTPEPDDGVESELQPVAIIGPTVRTLVRRPVPPRQPAAAPTQRRRPPPAGTDDVGDEAAETMPDLGWSPGRQKGPLPPPGPLPVPDVVREKAATPLGRVEHAEDDDGDDGDDDDVEIEVRERDEAVAPRRAPRAVPVFRGAQAATAAPPSAPVDAPAAPRRRRTAPLRAR